MTSAGGFSRVEPLGRHHVLAGFRCGRDALDTWLFKHALQSHLAGGSRTNVVCREARVVGFYSLAAGGIAADGAPGRIRRGLARHPVPIVVLTRLAVDQSAQGCGLGSALLRDVFLRVAQVAEVVAVRALLVHAKDEEAVAWYLARATFVRSPENPLDLYLLVKDLKATLAAT